MSEFFRLFLCLKIVNQKIKRCFYRDKSRFSQYFTFLLKCQKFKKYFLHFVIFVKKENAYYINYINLYLLLIFCVKKYFTCKFYLNFYIAVKEIVTLLL